MAKLKLNGLVTGLSGKINGSVAVYSGGRTFLRRNSYSQQRNLPLQSIQRTKIQQFSQLWRSYSSSVKSDFSLAVSDYPRIDVFGNTYYFTGYQLANFLNSNLKLINEPSLTSVPTYQAAHNVTVFSINFNTSVLAVNYQNNTADNDLLFYASRMFDNFKNPVVKELVFMKLDKSRVVNGLVNFFSEYTEKFGTPVSGKYISVGIKAVNYQTGNTFGVKTIGTFQVT